MNSIPTDRPRDIAGSKELRLALVCYGGVSLAIYMHGVTKEIQKLVEASAAFDANDRENPFEARTLQAVYWDVLKERSVRDGGVTTRVVVDIIAGTSAGGINGVVLAKALAHGLSQDELRGLWMDRGDIEQLLDVDHVPTVPLKGSTWLAGTALTRLWSRLSGKDFKPRHPLSGDKMLRWIHDALTGMDLGTGDPPQSLMPRDHTLELFVTVTDYYGYRRTIPIHDPPRVIDGDHRHVMRFGYGDGIDQFGPDYNPALSFAARATSSFPGAFPPINLANVEQILGEGSAELLRREFFDTYASSREEVDNTFFVDGGVLDNFPFGHAIDAIVDKPAHAEVERYLLYLEPHPGTPAEASGEEPGWTGTIWAGLSRIPSKEPIVTDLLKLRGFNERVERVNEVIEGAWERVRRTVVSGDENLYAEASALFGPQYDSYNRLKIDSVVENLAALASEAAEFAEESIQAFSIRQVIRSWASRQPDILGGDPGRPLTEAQTDFLRTFDLAYGRRRLRFAIQGVNELYSDLEDRTSRPTREDLDVVKDLLYAYEARLTAQRLLATEAGRELVEAVAAVFSGDRFVETLIPSNREGTTRAFGEADDTFRIFADSVSSDLANLRDRLRSLIENELDGYREGLADALSDRTSDWTPDARDRLEVRFRGFPLWDALVFPLRSLSDVGELDTVNVVRFSPDDALRISEEGAEKLEGISWMHFGAFFERRSRENDYLWGRLDSAERLIHLLGGTDADHFRSASLAILDEEQGALTEIPDVIEQIRRKVETPV